MDLDQLNNDQTKRYDASNQLRLQSNNATILTAIRSVFTSSELLDLKDQKGNLVLKINKEGRIFFIYFSFTSSLNPQSYYFQRIQTLEDE